MRLDSEHVAPELQTDYERGYADALDQLRATTEVFEATGIPVPSIRKLAIANGLGRIYGNTRVFTPAEVARLRQLHTPKYRRDE